MLTSYFNISLCCKLICYIKGPSLKFKATPEEINRVRKATSAKSKPKPAPKAASAARVEPPNGDKHPRSPLKPNQASPNPGAMKRVKGKQPEQDPSKLIEELRQALW